MQNVCLLSEINPGGTSVFDPIDQARRWFHFSPSAKLADSLGCEDESVFAAAIDEIASFVEGLGKQLVIRDWTYIDFIGFPFNQNPSLRFRLHEVLSDRFSISPVASVRHPLSQFLSTEKLQVLAERWDDQVVLRGMRSFAESIQEMTWIRFEDFVADPSRELQKFCGAWGIEFDPSCYDRLTDQANITGDISAIRESKINAPPATPIPPETLRKLKKSDDFIRSCELLGYPVPDDDQRSTIVLPPEIAKRIQEHRDAARDLVDSGEHEKAIVLLRKVLHERPGDDWAEKQLGNCLLAAGNVESAIGVLLAHLDRYPESVEAIRNLITAYMRIDRKFDAIPWQRRLLRYCRDDYQTMFSLGTSLTGIGAVDEGQTLCKTVMTHDPLHRGAAANYLLFLNYQSGPTAEEISKEHFRIATRFSERSDALERRTLAENERIKLAYLSADFRVHPVGKIARGIITGHDRKRFDLYAYCDQQKRDALTSEIEQFVTVFRDVSGMSDSELLEQVRADEIDVLIDLGGYTGGGNRPSVFARRGAPVQVSFLGYPNTSALHTIDYRITDRFADPPGLTEGLYSEKLIWLDSGCLAWDPYEIAKDVKAVDAGAVRIGAFNNVAKNSVAAIESWAQILHRNPDVKIILKYGDRYEVPLVRDRVCRIFAESGILPDRIEFLPVGPRIKDHLSVLASVDLALDSFPYQGTMTSLECLSVGTPILSLVGEYYAHRATSAMMMRLDLQELVASDPAEYVEIATQLISNVRSLRSLRGLIKERFYASSLVQPKKLAGNLEDWIESLFVRKPRG